MIAMNILYLSISYYQFIASVGWFGGELEFTLPGEKVVRLHGTEWSETQRFYHHLNTLWQQWSAK